jgi:hypothetical protein
MKREECLFPDFPAGENSDCRYPPEHYGEFPHLRIWPRQADFDPFDEFEDDKAVEQ